jgi:hypothetical protein
MCILVENAEEVAYLTAHGHWTKEPGEGSCFASTRAAFAAAKEELIGKFNIVQFFTLNGQIVNLDYGSGRRKEPARSSPGPNHKPQPELISRADAGDHRLNKP